MSPNLNLLISLALGAAIGAFVRMVWAKRKALYLIRSFNKSADIDALVNSKLSQLRIEMDADKAKIFQFHNGGNFFNGKSIKKMSLTHLQLRINVAPPDITHLQNLPTSLFPNMMKRFINGPGAIFWSAKDAPDPFLRARHIDEKIEQVMIAGIYECETGNVIGFVSLNFLREINFKIDEPRLLGFAAELSEILGR